MHTPGHEEEGAAPQREPAAPRPPTRGVPGHLGRMAWTGVSNRAVARALEGVSQPSDAGEREATRLATRAEPVATAASAPPPTGLDPAARTAMVGLFADPFDDVVLHTNAGAGRVAESVGADAVTRGRDVFFAPGRYRPDTAAGARLLAHELVHTRQPEAASTVHRDGDATPVVHQIEAANPEVFLFAGTATRQQIAATLYGDPTMSSAVEFVQTPESKVVDGVIAQGARARNPAQLAEQALKSLRWALDTALPLDVQRTVSILSEASIDGGDEATLAAICLRWSQRSEIPTAAGENYFDAYLGALNRQTLTQPHWYTLGIDSTSKTALEWLQVEAEGSSGEQIKKAIELRSTAFKGTTGYKVTDRQPEFQTGDIVGRVNSEEHGTYPVRVLETIGHDIDADATVRLVQRRLIGAGSKSGLGTGVVIPSPTGGYTGYLVDFALLDAFVPHPFQDEAAQYSWYYPGTRMVAEHHLWDRATRSQFQGDVRAQSTDWEADLIGFEAAAVKIRASAAGGILSKETVEAWQRSDRAMIEVSGRLRAKQAVDAAGTAPIVRAFFDQARAQVKALDKWETIDLDPMGESLNSTMTILANPYFEEGYHAQLVARLAVSVTPQQWRAVLNDYHKVSEKMDEFLATRLRETGGEKGKEQASQLEYAGAAGRQLDNLTTDHPTGRRIRATFYPLDALTAGQDGLGEPTATPMNCLFYVYRDGVTWHLVDLTTPKKEKATSEAGGTDTSPPHALFHELNTRLRFPRGRLYWEMPDGNIHQMTTTAEASLSEWLKWLGMTAAIMGMAIGTLGASLPATIMIVGGSALGAVGSGVELHEKSEAGVLTDADIVVGIADIISGLATAGAATSGHIIRSAALTSGSAARLGTTLDAHVYRQLVGVSFAGQAVSFVVTTRQILDEYYKAKAAADQAGSDLALRRLLMHLFLSGGMTLIGAKSDIADMTRGRTLTLGKIDGADVALPVRPEADALHDEWVAEMAKLGTRGQTGPRSGAPLEPGLVGRYDDARSAYQAYDATLKRPGEAEVGVFRNPQGEYVVMIGKATSVDPPTSGGPWRAVVHYHSNPGNALTMRMPAAADVDGAIQVARDTGRPVTEFVEAPLPGGGRTVTSYTVTPDGKITIEYVRPNGERVVQSFGDVAAYRTELNSRDVAVDPSSPHYREMMEDLDALYRGGGAGAAGRRTSMGAGWEAQLDAVGGQPAREALVNAFAAQPGRLEILVGELGAVEVNRLGVRLGPDVLARVAAKVDGQAVRNLSFGLDPADLDALVAAHTPAHLAWAARSQNGPTAREVLGLPVNVLTALSDPAADLPAAIVRRLITGPGALDAARLTAVVGAVQPADFALLRQQFGNEGFIQVMKTDERPTALRDMAVRLRDSGNELGAAGPLPSAANVLDSNLLIPIQRLRDGVPWKGPPGKHAMHDADRDRITFLGKKVGVTFTGKDGAPTPAELEEMMTKLGNRTPVAVLAETPAVTGTDRGASMVVDRNSVDYQLALREMATGDRNQQVGTDVGGADRLAVADILFADRAPGAAPPVFYTDDERVMRPLLERWGVAGTYTQVGQHMKKGEKQGSWAERFAAANPNGFEIVIRGRRMRVVLVR